uniref:Uncharacterized protein n=1 Tax=Craspedostauros australis TaxID=1486917 RepID=A0A7R9X118_9STRA|mmetsp:Transcript_4914/g.12974  ORF Transcript_4914/g.12974 Transcript_4914/m.12974 type:complete len:283 (+) Transcript_4914:256-1104(+)|eukprot:CAMPEP_0198114714 /NCGR_PEP_ID=MMETSP1442-20131203/6013_1 /TAXON_ID= /ORGANISM="Craspedostauros australis, Strain CCMP3328" /LENGTH=282 /DNA_ID=CAMNT_0043772087 /DNA_START=186 /DNA_END=1034 /DNA_ORIENTATION=-
MVEIQYYVPPLEDDDESEMPPPMVPARLIPSCDEILYDDVFLEPVAPPNVLNRREAPTNAFGASNTEGAQDRMHFGALRQRRANGNASAPTGSFRNHDNSNHDNGSNNNESNSSSSNDSDADDSDRSTLLASGATGAVLGTLIGGPALGILAGFGSAYACSQPAGTSAGDVGRAMAEIGALARSRAIEIDQRHGVAHKVKAGMAQAWGYAKRMNQNHKLLQRFQDFVVWSVATTIEMVQEKRGLRNNGGSGPDAAEASTSRDTRGARQAQSSNTPSVRAEAY